MYIYIYYIYIYIYKCAIIGLTLWHAMLGNASESQENFISWHLVAWHFSICDSQYEAIIKQCIYAPQQCEKNIFKNSYFLKQKVITVNEGSMERKICFYKTIQ